MKTYKTSPLKLLINTFYCFITTGFVFLISGFIFEQYIKIENGAFITCILAIVIFLSYFSLVVLDNILTITIKDSVLIIKKFRHTTTYNLSEDSNLYASYKIINDSKDLLIYEKGQSYPIKTISLDAISNSNFESILEDLHITGKYQKVEKITIERN